MTRKIACGDLVRLSSLECEHRPESYIGQIALVISTDVPVAGTTLFMRDMILITDPNIPDTFLEVLLGEVELFQSA